MPTYRERISKVSAMPADLMGADFCDELDIKIKNLATWVSRIEDGLAILDRKVTDCCSDSARAALRAEISGLRAEVEALKSKIPASPSPPTG